MKKLVFLLFIISNGIFSQDDVASRYAQMITTADLKDNLSIIASDAMEGRYTGSRGQKMAAAFIANHFKTVGLSVPANGSYYMPVELTSSRTLEAYIKSGTAKYTNYDEIAYIGQMPSHGEVSLETIYVGKATDTELANLDIKDKAVVVLLNELNLSSIRKMASTLGAKGAKMVLAVSVDKPKEFTAWVSKIKSFSDKSSLSLTKVDPNAFNKDAFLVSQSVASKILNVSFEDLEKAAKDGASPKLLAKIKPTRMVYSVSTENKIIESENIVGFLEGTDKKDEVMVISAHFDHIGLHEGDDKVNNGADDDGSGTVSVLQLAKIFAQAKKDGHGPRRSILFITVTGEEEGLFGSQYYVEHPIYPLTNTIVDLNIDMVGRKDPEHATKPDYVYVIGSDKLSSELHQINEINNKTYTKLDFDYTYNDENHPTNLYKRSDHWNFAKNNVPIIFYFDGIHEDYHKPSDEVSKIDFELLAKRAKIIFYTAWELANREKRISVDKK